MSNSTLLSLPAGRSIVCADIPAFDANSLRRIILENIRGGGRLAALLAYKDDDGKLVLLPVIAHDARGMLSIGTTRLENGKFAAMTPDCPQAQWFEREISEQWGIDFGGHPWMKPVRYCGDSIINHGLSAGQARPTTDFMRIKGEQIHEVAVGPVHAGIIEPGHFRFQCHGEKVYHLEIALGYQHRGIEQALLNGPGLRAIHYAETAAGDTTIGHATAFCQAIESLAGVNPPGRAQVIRAIALELERLANHTGDLGALAGDIGYLPTASFCGRLRGDFLNLTALICGSRFGRGLIRPGGVAFDINEIRLRAIVSKLDRIMRDTTNAVNLLWRTSSVRARFEETGRLTPETARGLGMVGVAARACGLDMDARHNHPSGVYRFFQPPISTYHTGDVFARAYVRWLEIQRSAQLIRELVAGFPSGQITAPASVTPRPDRLAISLVEGWRGEICHVAITNSTGRLRVYKIFDPSCHNWLGLAMAMRGEQISDFPLCNKSFNLSYCGHDL